MIEKIFSKEEIEQIDAIFSLSLLEDLKGDLEKDITNLAVGLSKTKAQYAFTARHELIICGLPIIEYFFKTYSPHTEIRFFAKDGERVDNIFAEISGFASEILSLERIALNILQRLSSIATVTHGYSELIAHTKAKIRDTRKTGIAIRPLDKYAFRIGGGVNHRMGLFDKILVKDNHLILQPLEKAIDNVQAFVAKNPKFTKFQIECDDLNQVEVCLEKQVPEILLDNMKIPEVIEAKRMRDAISKHTLLEASGGLNERNILAYAETGIDYLAIGSITHSVKAVDIGLD